MNDRRKFRRFVKNYRKELKGFCVKIALTIVEINEKTFSHTKVCQKLSTRK